LTDQDALTAITSLFVRFCPTGGFVGAALTSQLLNAMKITAKLLEVFETKQVTASFRKREFVVEYATNPQYPEFLKFELVQDKCGQLDRFSAGDELDIHFDLKGRKWNDPRGEIKYFNSLQAWKLEPPGEQPASPAGDADAFGDCPPDWLTETDESGNPF
jgi:hypothetical protein